MGQFEEQAIVTLDAEALPQLLEAAEVVREVDTCLTGWIRILRIENQFAVQEQTPEGEVLVRRLDSRGTAEHFVEQRLRDYERMWDGCGCTIDYRT
jgi:hypothetical protein